MSDNSEPEWFTLPTPKDTIVGVDSCIHCCSRLPRDRAEFLRETGRAMVCTSCASESSRMVLMEYGHKTAGYAVIIPRGSEQRALRCFRRAR